MRWLFTAVIAVFVLFGGQLLRVQGFDAAATQKTALGKRTQTSVVPALRGEILDTHGQVLAETVRRYTVVADPQAIAKYAKKIDGKRTPVGAVVAAQDVAPLLGMTPAELTKSFTKPGTRYVIVKKQVNPVDWAKVRALGVPGLAAETTTARVYPTGMTSGQLVGFVQPNDQSPSAGIELLANKALAGTPGKSEGELARDGYLIPGTQRDVTTAVDGRNVALTIDADLQFYAHNALARQVTAVGAQLGQVVVIEAATGKIRAAATYPSFDPNNLATAAKGTISDQTFVGGFEPGSTGKMMTIAAALEEKAITPDTGVLVPNRLPRAGELFKDHEDHGVEQLTATGVLAKSSNIGTMLIGERVPAEKMREYYAKFGIGTRTEVGFPNESSGYLPPLSAWQGATRYVPLFGQGYSLTAVQATDVAATIANGGVRMPVSLIEAVADDNGVLQPVAAKPGVRVVSSDTAAKVSRMAEEVTGKDGTASAARIAGYRVAGKTGTANKYDEKTGGYNGYTASFVGFAPAEKPKYVVGVFIQNPGGNIFGGFNAGPVFNQVMTYLIQRDALPPSTPSTLDYHVWAEGLSSDDPTVLSEARAKRDGL